MATVVVNFARSLLALRQQRLVDVALIADINHENLRHFLEGREVPIRHETAKAAFRALGVENGAFTEGIHRWSIGSKGFMKGKGQFDLLGDVAKLLKGSTMHELVSPKGKKQKAYLIKTPKNARIVLRIDLPALTKDRVPEMTDLEPLETIQVNQRIWNMIESFDLTDNDFEMLTSGDHELVGWDRLRATALEFRVTPKQITEWIMSTRGESAATEEDKEYKLQLIVDNTNREDMSLDDLTSDDHGSDEVPVLTDTVQPKKVSNGYAFLSGKTAAQ